MDLSIFKWGFWLWINGAGISVEWDRPVLFSERYGYRRVRRWGRISMQLLPRRRL